MKKILPYLEKLLSYLKKIPACFKKVISWPGKLRPYWEKVAAFFQHVWKKVCPYVQKALAYVIIGWNKIRPYCIKALCWLKAFWKKIRPYVMKGLPYAVVSLLSITITLTATIAIMPKPREQTKLDMLEQLILDYFIGESDQTAMEDAAANAMIEALGDRWSYYIPADSYEAYLEDIKNAYVGIGITISGMREDGIGLDVLGVTAGGPAEKAGVLKGDTIIGVDGTAIAGMDVNEIKKMIMGDAETTVKLKLLRGETELELDVTRREIKTAVATAEMLEGQIGLVTIVNFNSNCASETIAAVEKLITDGAQKLIFDVRNNPGGYASEMVKALDRLLPEGIKLFTAVDYADNETTELSDAVCVELPMAVIVNEDSYSAAEFFAAALSENDAAIVVGEQTCGKGYFQNTFRLPDGSAVGLSIGKYYTPKGNSLADVGITPQVMVPVSDKIAAQIASGNLEPMQDPQILAAIEALQ